MSIVQKGNQVTNLLSDNRKVTFGKYFFGYVTIGAQSTRLTRFFEVLCRTKIIRQTTVRIILVRHTPEDLKDAETKIAYIEDLKKIAKGSKTADEFKRIVNGKYPDYGGENYLAMTANMFFE